MKTHNLVDSTACLAPLGDNFRQARKKKFPHDTQADFARRLNISRATLQKMDMGNLSVSLASYYAAAELLGMADPFHALFELPVDLFEAVP